MIFPTIKLQGHIDLSLIVLYNHEIQLDYEVLCNEEIILVVPKSHNLAHLAENAASGKRPVIDLSLFKDEPFVLMKQGTKIRQIADNILKDEGITPNVLLENSSINTVQYTVANGTAVSLIPEKIINYESMGRNSVFFSVNPQKYHWPIIVAYRKGTYLNRAMVDFISMLKSYLNSDYTSKQRN
jgi:DNA-binding transcriptional LysR family regulator